MNLSTDEKFIQLVKDHEGFSPIIYDCPAGYPTLGYGRNMMRNDVQWVDRCTPEQATVWLKQDIQGVQTDLDNNLPFWSDLPKVVRYALADMCFNLGISRLLQFKRMIQALRDHNFELAAFEARDSLWFKQVKRRGVTITNMIESGNS